MRNVREECDPVIMQRRNGGAGVAVGTLLYRSRGFVGKIFLVFLFLQGFFVLRSPGASLQTLKGQALRVGNLLQGQPGHDLNALYRERVRDPHEDISENGAKRESGRNKLELTESKEERHDISEAISVTKGDRRALHEGRALGRKAGGAGLRGESLDDRVGSRDAESVQIGRATEYLPGESDSGIWQVPLSAPPSGLTCEAWLDGPTGDSVRYSRDFNLSPVLVSDGRDKVWDRCDVGCHFTPDAGALKFDARMTASQDGDDVAGVLRSMEPRKYYAINDVIEAKKHGYQVVMTVHLNSDVPVGYFSWEEYDIMRPIAPKNAWPALAAVFISNCNANNFRLRAVEGLNDRVPIDSYGRCARNRPSVDDKVDRIGHYLFSLAFENSCEDDYVTEKFWQSLVAGTIPVVVGAPNIAHFSPSNNSILHIKSVEEIESVARDMVRIAADPIAIAAMTRWKIDGPSHQFKALLDMSAVHSSCRLCIHLADKLRRVEEERDVVTRPCRCRDGESTVYHIYVRERGQFHFQSVYLRSSTLTLEKLTQLIRRKFLSLTYVPNWMRVRPAVLSSPENMKLKVYRIYPVGSSQQELLYGDAWFQNNTQMIGYLGHHPCLQLEVVFI